MCLISPFSPSNVDIIDSYFYMSFLMYITSHYVDYMNFFLILSEIKKLTSVLFKSGCSGSLYCKLTQSYYVKVYIKH